MAELISVHDPVESAGKPKLVFIHGLGGDIRKTWMADSHDAETLWPRWVGEDTACPVWLLGYDAASTRWRGDATALPRQATAVIERLSNEPRLSNGPLILIGHSLGGLVIKTALQHGMSRDVERHTKLANNIKGVAFVGTPHFGSRLASIACWLRIFRANPQMSNLRLDDANLETLNQYFLKLRGDLSFRTRVFVETKPARLPGWLGRLLPGVTIVSPMSSEAHIPGEVGIPIDANHFTICKPQSRNAAIHSSLIAFIREVEAASAPSVRIISPAPIASENVEAILPEHRVDASVHLALSAFEACLEGNTAAPVCASACVVTDDPDRLRQQLQEIPALIQKDPLINRAAKEHARGKSLLQLVEDPGTRMLALRELSVISFSAYLYYCPKEAFDRLSTAERVRKLFVDPLLHRLSKKGESFRQVHTRVVEIDAYLRQAAEAVQSEYHRAVNIPRSGNVKFQVLEELAALIAKASCNHLGSLENAEAANLFENLRTRIRYAENVSTSEKHKRDENPLP